MASRFAPPDVRARLVALYAVNYEIARTAEVVSEPGVGAIRLAWWREAVGEVLAGAPARGHAALIALADVQRAHPIDEVTLIALIEAHGADLEAAPFAAISDLESHVHATAGGIMRLALETCGRTLDEDLLIFVRNAGLAWGLTGLLRAEPLWRARGRRLLGGEGCSHHALIERARSAYAEARAIAPDLASALFPAFGYIALAPAYLRALEQGREPPALLARQLRLIGAAAAGRL